MANRNRLISDNGNGFASFYVNHAPYSYAFKPAAPVNRGVPIRPGLTQGYAVRAFKAVLPGSSGFFGRRSANGT